MEPNSSLGKAITYMLNHWLKPTLFPREAGAPLDNNIRERALKKMILHRQNSYFFVIQNGALVADLYASLIHTCELNGMNAFDDLTELELHAEERAEHPEEWMPWNDQATLERVNACRWHRGTEQATVNAHARRRQPARPPLNRTSPRPSQTAVTFHVAAMSA